jgi:hypothetical protein
VADDPNLLDEGFELVPPDSDPPDAQAELDLEDALASGDDVSFAITEDAPPPLGRSYAWDFIEHRVVPGQAGGPLMTYGLDTLATWIEKCLRTRRGENPAVDPDFGVEIMPSDLLDGGPFDGGAIAEYEDSVKRALLVHPRIADVEFGAGSVSYTDGDDAVFVNMRVIPEGDDLDELTVDNLALPLGV